MAAALTIALVLTLILYFVNEAENFLQGFFVSNIIWLVIDWCDCIVIDWSFRCAP